MTKSRGIGRGWAKGLTAESDPRIRGRGWARGRTAASDARIARAAAGHRGKSYVRRVSSTEGRWRGYIASPTGWSSDMAYAVGLIATDGCLVTGRKRLQFGSSDRELVELLLRCLQRPARIRVELTQLGNPYYRTQFGAARLYEWLLTIGLTPRKSLTIGPIDVPAEFLVPLARGLLDGDGTITNKSYRADTSGRAGYRWEYLQTRFVSASHRHLEWLEAQLRAVLGVCGYLQRVHQADGRVISELRYGKRASLVLLPTLYNDASSPRLTRKFEVWRAYAHRHGLPAHGAALLE